MGPQTLSAAFFISRQESPGWLVLAAIATFTLFLQVLACRCIAKSLTPRIAPIVTDPTVLVVLEPAFAFRHIAFRQWKFWRRSRQEASTFHALCCLAGTWRKANRNCVKFRILDSRYFPAFVGPDTVLFSIVANEQEQAE